MVDIIKGVKEITEPSDPATGSSGGILTGLTRKIDEVLDNTVNKIGTFGAPGRNFALLGNPEKDGGGIHEYAMSRDIANSFNESFLDSASEGKEAGGFAGFLGGMVKGAVKGLNSAAIARRPWDTDLREPTMRLNSVLEERSYMDFYFPNIGIGDRGRRRVAFFENPSIRENRLANYATQNIVARNEPARLYVGSGPRKLTVDFTFTLPHVEYFFKLCYEASLRGFGTDVPYIPVGEDRFKGDRPRSSYQDYMAFTYGHLQKFFGAQFQTSPNGSVAEAQKQRQQQPFSDLIGNGLSFLTGGRAPNATGATRAAITRQGARVENRGVKGPRFYEPTFQEPKPGYEFKDKEVTTNEVRHIMSLATEPKMIGKESMGMMATYYTQFVIDTIRASVVGDNVKGAQLGPPIVRFRHGTLFNESPFIVKSFNITYPTDKGYEYRTLVPRQVKFSLTLEEFHQVHGSHHGDAAKERVPDATDILNI